MAEEIDKMLGDLSHMEPHERTRDDDGHALKSLIDLPELPGVQQIFLGADIGLVNDPTVVTLWAIMPDEEAFQAAPRPHVPPLALPREADPLALYIIAWKYGKRLRGAGLDVTGLGLPIFQAIEDDEIAPKHLIDVTRGYVFNAKLPVGVDESLVTEDNSGTCATTSATSWRSWRTPSPARSATS
jgi:hypothetical protein